MFPRPCAVQVPVPCEVMSIDPIFRLGDIASSDEDFPMCFFWLCPEGCSHSEKSEIVKLANKLSKPTQLTRQKQTSQLPLPSSSQGRLAPAHGAGSTNACSVSQDAEPGNSSPTHSRKRKVYSHGSFVAYNPVYVGLKVGLYNLNSCQFQEYPRSTGLKL